MERLKQPTAAEFLRCLADSAKIELYNALLTIVRQNAKGHPVGHERYCQSARRLALCVRPRRPRGRLVERADSMKEEKPLEAIGAIIDAVGLAAFLRAVGEACETRSAALMETAPDIGHALTHDEEPPEEWRRAFDVSRAWHIGFDLRNLAAHFENRLKTAGASRAEKQEIERQSQLEAARRVVACLEAGGTPGPARY